MTQNFNTAPTDETPIREVLAFVKHHAARITERQRDKQKPATKSEADRFEPLREWFREKSPFGCQMREMARAMTLLIKCSTGETIDPILGGSSSGDHPRKGTILVNRNEELFIYVHDKDNDGESPYGSCDDEGEFVGNRLGNLDYAREEHGLSLASSDQVEEFFDNLFIDAKSLRQIAEGIADQEDID